MKKDKFSTGIIHTINTPLISTINKVKGAIHLCVSFILNLISIKKLQKKGVLPRLCKIIMKNAKTVTFADLENNGEIVRVSAKGVDDDVKTGLVLTYS